MRACVFAAGLALAVGCGCGKRADGPGAPGAGAADLGEVLKAYSANPAAADERYKGRTLAVVAHPVRLGRVGGDTVADAAPPGFLDPPRFARFYFASEAEAAKVRPGPSYTLTGRCEGLSGDAVVFRGCAAVENAVPPAAAPGAGGKSADQK